MTLVDDQRPSAVEAAAKGTELLGELERQLAKGIKVVRGRLRVEYPHVIRDPVYGDIRVTDVEFTVLNTREMQRLRWIRQLGLTSFVYPGADHSRLSHSIGCVQVVETMLRHMELQEGASIEPDVRLTARLYALTHDFPHVAFGHTLEDEFGFWERHDKNVARHSRLITSEASELGTVLRNSEVGREVLALLDPEADETDQHIAYDLVLGLIGADVLDYVNRDALFCGLMHRIDDAIYRQFRLQPVVATGSRRLISLMGGKYGVRVDREFAVETILQERYAMFLKVYCHSAKIAASCVLARALLMELEKARRSRRGRTDSLQEESFEWLGDEAVLRLLAGSTSTSVKRLAKLVLDRRIPPGVYRALLLSPEERNENAYDDRRGDFRSRGFLTPAGRAELEQAISRLSGVGIDKIIVYCPAKAPGYQRAEHWVSERRTETAKRRAPSSFSSILSRHLGLWEFWAFVLEGNERDKRAVAQAAEELVMRPNVIGQYRRESLIS